MKKNELTRLIERYYPKSTHGRERHYRLVHGKKADKDPCKWLLHEEFYDSNWCFGVLVLLSVVIGVPIGFAIESADHIGLKLGISLGITVSAVIVTVLGIVVMNWFKGDLLFGRKLKCACYWRVLLKDILSRPPIPAVILATIEAIEAEAEGRQRVTLAFVSERETGLEQHRDRLIGVLANINQRLDQGVPANREFLTQSRQMEAEETLERVRQDLVEVQAQKQQVTDALKPARELAVQLRLIYADSYEVETIARAKGAVAETVSWQAYQEDLLAFHREAVEAQTNMTTIAEAVGARMAAEREMEELLGIAESHQSLNA